MSGTRAGRAAEIAEAGLALWEAAGEADVRHHVESLDHGPSRGTAGEAIRDVKRVSEALGPVGFAWGWEVRGERLDTFGLGEDQRVIHSCVLRAWFRQPDGSKGHVEHVGRTRAAYWARPRRPGEGPRYVVDEEFAKKSVTDALSKIVASLGASVGIRLGRFDGDEHMAPTPAEEPEGAVADGNAAEPEERLVDYARGIPAEARRAETWDAAVEVAREIEGTLDGRPLRPRPAGAPASRERRRAPARVGAAEPAEDLPF